MTSKIDVSIDDKGNVSAKVYGARTCWAKIDRPEPDMDEATGLARMNDDGTPRMKWRTQLLVPKSAPGVTELRTAAEALRKRNGGAGKLAAIKDGDAEIARLVGEGKRPEDLELYRGMAILSASSSRRPDIRGTDIYSGCEVAAGIRLHWYEAKGNKGIAAYLNAIVKTGPGERIGGGGMTADDLGVAEYREEPADPLSGSRGSVPGPDDWGT